MALFGVILAVEVCISLVVIIPYGDQRKQELGQFLSKRIPLRLIGQILAAVILFFLANAFFDTRRSHFVHQDAAMRQQAFAAQYEYFQIMGIAVLGLVMWRFWALLRKSNVLEKSEQAVKRQLQSSSTYCETLMKENTALEKDNERLKNLRSRAQPTTSAGADFEMDSTRDPKMVLIEENAGLQKIIDGLKRELKTCETQVSALKKQAQAQSNEYKRLMKDKENLETELEDYQIMFSGGKTKNS